MKNKKIATYFLLFLIVALGLFLRIYNIDNVPPGVYPDEAVNGEDALRALETGQFQWFYPANQGREGLFMNLIALCFKLFGASVLTLKLPAIIFGTLTIWGTYLLTKELFQTCLPEGRKERLALISAFLVAVSFWAINFNRISFRANMLPFILVFSFYFLWKGLRTKKLFDFAAGGFIFGIGLHTYIAFRIAPAVLIITLVSLMLSRKNFLKDYWRPILIFVIFSIIAAAPMFYTFFFAHPEYLESRSSSISVLSPEVNKGNLIGTFLKSFGLSLIKYNFVGDMNWRHNFPPYPLLDTATGIAFLFGLIYSFVWSFKLFFARLVQKVRDSRMDIHLFLLGWFFVMLAPEFMTAEGNPHALRAIGTLPVVFIFSALTFNYLLEKSRKETYLFQKITTSLVVLILISSGIFNSVKYHYFWARKPETARAFEKVLMNVSAYLRTLPQGKEKIIITGSMQRIPIKVFNSRMENLKFYYPGEIDQIQPTENSVIIMTEKNDEIISKLQKNLPAFKLEEIKDALGISYYILK